MNEQALQGLLPQADVASQTRALQYFEQLKDSQDGWKLCGSALTSMVYHGNDHAKFFCYQVIEHYLKTRYSSTTQAEQQEMKSLISALLQLLSQESTKEKSFIRNKAAQIVSLAFVCDYPNKWPDFFDDLLRSLSLGPLAVEMYLRILSAIDSEVVDREIVHTQQETERNTLIKDTMREQCVQQLVDSWYQVITNYQNSQPEITCQCLDIIGKYVSWIDINLIANDRFVGVLLQFLKMALLKESACECIHEIVGKGMDPVAKTKLIESFANVLETAGIMQPEDEEGDFLSKLAKLVNGMGVQLILSWQRLVKSGDNQNAAATLLALESKVTLSFRYLGDEDDDVSGAVTTFAHDYINVLKQMTVLSEKHQAHIKALLCVVVKKMKYDDSYNFEKEGEDEAMFQEYRKQLKVIFNNLAQLDGQLILVTVHELVSNTFQNWKTMEVKDVEVAVMLMYMLGEALPASHGQHFGVNAAKTSVLQEMMRQLVTSGISHHPHSAVSLLYFESVLRYEKFFSAEPQYVPEVLMSFLDERGLHNRHPQVRSRVAYLFSRFIKSVKNHIQNFVEEILKRVQDLLIINTPDNGIDHLLTSDNQLFMYETAGVLIVSSQFEPQKKEQLMKNLLSPIVSKFDELLAKMCSETDGQRQQGFAMSLSQAMAFASRTSKGFSNAQTMKACGCVKVYTDTLQVFLRALNVPIHRQLLHTGVRQFLHRMVVCLESEILPFVPIAMEHLLKQVEARELHDFLPLMNQVTAKFKTQIVPFLQQVFMPLVTTVFDVLGRQTDELDQVAANDKKMLQRSYFYFISNIVNNDVSEILAHQDSANLQQVLLTLIHGAVELVDPQAQKTSFGVLRKLIELWGGKDGLPGFGEFMYEHIVPACFMAPMKSTFDLSDAQTVLTLSETACCMKAILEKRDMELVNYLESSYLPKMNLSPELSQEYIQALKSDIKIYRNYLKVFFTKAKS